MNALESFCYQCNRIDAHCICPKAWERTERAAVLPQDSVVQGRSERPAPLVPERSRSEAIAALAKELAIWLDEHDMQITYWSPSLHRRYPLEHDSVVEVIKPFFERVAGITASNTK